MAKKDEGQPEALVKYQKEQKKLKADFYKQHGINGLSDTKKAQLYKLNKEIIDTDNAVDQLSQVSDALKASAKLLSKESISAIKKEISAVSNNWSNPTSTSGKTMKEMLMNHLIATYKK